MINQKQLNLKNEYLLHKRLYISCADLNIASEFADFLLKNNLNYYPWEKKGKIYIKQAAYTISLIVSYSRPFTRSDGLPIITIDFMKFTKHQRELHEKILNLRHQVYAHSDSAMYKVDPVKLGDLSTSIYGQPFFRLTKSDIVELKRMILKVECILGKKQKELELKLIK